MSHGGDPKSRSSKTQLWMTRRAKSSRLWIASRSHHWRSCCLARCSSIPKLARLTPEVNANPRHFFWTNLLWIGVEMRPEELERVKKEEENLNHIWGLAEVLVFLWVIPPLAYCKGTQAYESRWLAPMFFSHLNSSHPTGVIPLCQSISPAPWEERDPVISSLRWSIQFEANPYLSQIGGVYSHSLASLQLRFRELESCPWLGSQDVAFDQLQEAGGVESRS